VAEMKDVNDFEGGKLTYTGKLSGKGTFIYAGIKIPKGIKETEEFIPEEDWWRLNQDTMHNYHSLIRALRTIGTLIPLLEYT
jgi:hypothetical protein